MTTIHSQPVIHRIPKSAFPMSPIIWMAGVSWCAQPFGWMSLFTPLRWIQKPLQTEELSLCKQICTHHKQKMDCNNHPPNVSPQPLVLKTCFVCVSAFLNESCSSEEPKFHCPVQCYPKMLYIALLKCIFGRKAAFNAVHHTDPQAYYIPPISMLFISFSWFCYF